MEKRCGCPMCKTREDLEDLRQFTATACAFRDIMHHNFKPDEEANLRLLARKAEGQLTVGGVVERINSYTAPPVSPQYRHPLEPPEAFA